MTGPDLVKAVGSAVAAFNAGNREAVGAVLGRSWFTHEPPADERGASEVIGPLIVDFSRAFPDVVIELLDLRAADGGAVGRVAVRGTNAQALWGVPTTGTAIDWEFSFRVRVAAGGLALNLDDLSTPVIMDLLRQLELVNAADQMHLPRRHPDSVIPEIIMRLAFTGQVADKPCGHLGEVRVTQSDATGCDRCGPDEVWPALRMCLTCGHVGCCDTSTNKHARGHYEQTGHPLMRSLGAGEAWMWCYVDGVLRGRDTLERLARELRA